MFKKIAIALFISSISVSSYAYLIGSNLTIENKTNIPMEINVDAAEGKITKLISPHAMITLNLNVNGWKLYHSTTAPFTITSVPLHSDSSVYVEGRVAYYVYDWPSHQYSFLDSLSVASGITIEPSYSCAVSDNTFENKIVIDGTPPENGGIQPTKKFP